MVAMVAAATVTYQIKHHAENKLAEVRRLRAEVHLEQQTIDLLEADWSLLNQPARVQHLVETFKEELQLETMQSTQIATVDELPERLLQIEELIAGGPEAFTDPTITGSVLQ
jgi:hypothetical protein